MVTATSLAHRNVSEHIDRTKTSPGGRTQLAAISAPVV
jgi:hypothetical protein